jgi:hypothetical protein
MTQPHEQKKSVLAGHKKEGRKLIPPYVAALGQPSHINWLDTIVPEVIWIGLLHQKFGQKEGITLALELAQKTDNIAKAKGKTFFAAASDYRNLDAEKKNAFIADLANSKKLIQFQHALFPLTHFYPTCPLNFLASQENMCEPSDALHCLKSVLYDLYDKERQTTVFVQATVVYIAFVLGRLKVKAGLTLASFPEVENYPDTEMSKRVAASVRSTILTFFGSAKHDAPTTWPVEFWNQGMEIENCVFK